MSNTAYLIEFTKKALEPNSKSYQSLCDSMKEVLGIIESLLKDMACVEDELDRKRIRIEGYQSKK
ncbi:12559_t:CDS:1 [Funneliformis caledonium]|uniref:12559_t:CDS:1 n=1 Tax=Funneliformis caledonium TaxID=1117310 RepID=A0A9N9HVC2_9GLOM|nr:12559_t:CDS:1 [Funneliformis caledonium]